MKAPPLSDRVLGIDPGLNTTGYGVLERTPTGFKLVEAGVIRPGKGDLAKRVLSLFEGIDQVILDCHPSAVAIEQLYSHYKHPRTAILMGHARGVFLLAAAKRGLPVVSYPSTKVKLLVTGSGRASKPQMQMAVMRELNLATVPEPHDIADALAVALCHAHTLSRV